jgi:phospholipase D1/2
MAQLLLHGLIDARIVAADLSVTSDGQLQPTKKVEVVTVVYSAWRSLVKSCLNVLEQPNSWFGFLLSLAALPND